MKQRVMIAMALLCEPQLLIADEPTTALDVTIQAQILHLIRELQKRTGAAVLFITHDMGVVAEMCDEVAVMYAGRVVEQAEVHRHLPAQPPSLHARACCAACRRKAKAKRPSCRPSKALVPSLLDPPPCCRFADRCWKRKSLDEAEQKRCFTRRPEAAAIRGVACRLPLSGDGRRAVSDSRTAARRRGPEEILPAARRRVRRQDRRCARGRWRRSHGHRKAKRWGWSANRAAENRHSAAQSCGWKSPPQGRVLFEGRDLAQRQRRGTVPACGATSR